MDTTQKVSALRALMKENNIQAYVVPSADPHQSEYVASHLHRRAFISNFTGSAGTAVITDKKSLLWTDGRYWLQAGNELDKDWELMKDRLSTTPSVEAHLSNILPKNARVGVDPRLVSKQAVNGYKRTFDESGHELVFIHDNLVDKIWSERPAAPSHPVFAHTTKYAGQTSQDKINRIRESLQEHDADALVVSALDEVAWLLNVRGSDVSFNPVIISYVIVSLDKVQFFVDVNKVSQEVKEHLGKGVSVLPYEDFFSELEKLSKANQRVWIDPSSSQAVFNCVSDPSLLLEKTSPINMMKSLKNKVEIDGMKNCHIRDAAALIQFLSWLEDEVAKGNSELTEVSVADKLEEFRKEQPDFVSLSFETISGFGSNGAIIHYGPKKETCAKIDSSKMYLLDSGGQYRDGTTDVTRTTHFGTPTQHEKECYTRVLQGHIKLATVVFPDGSTTGKDLDILARMSLYSLGLNYAHGTGHGVGAFLNVHEGPQGISARTSANICYLQEGMTITNEPGYYEEGAFGIRIENTAFVTRANTKFNNGDYLKLENFTVVPYESKLIDTDLMDESDIKYVNEYHAECLSKVSPLLQNNARALEWLKNKTQPLRKSNK